MHMYAMAQPKTIFVSFARSLRSLEPDLLGHDGLRSLARKCPAVCRPSSSDLRAIKRAWRPALYKRIHDRRITCWSREARGHRTTKTTSTSAAKRGFHCVRLHLSDRSPLRNNSGDVSSHRFGCHSPRLCNGTSRRPVPDERSIAQKTSAARNIVHRWIQHEFARLTLTSETRRDSL